MFPKIKEISRPNEVEVVIFMWIWIKNKSEPSFFHRMKKQNECLEKCVVVNDDDIEK